MELKKIIDNDDYIICDSMSEIQEVFQRIKSLGGSLGEFADPSDFSDGFNCVTMARSKRGFVNLPYKRMILTRGGTGITAKYFLSSTPPTPPAPDLLPNYKRMYEMLVTLDTILRPLKINPADLEVMNQLQQLLLTAKIDLEWHP